MQSYSIYELSCGTDERKNLIDGRSETIYNNGGASDNASAWDKSNNRKYD